MSIEILKVRLHETKKGTGLILHVDRGEEGSSVETHKPTIHKDLKKALDALRIHFAVMVGYISPGEVEIAHVDEDQVENFIVKGYSIGGDEGEGTRGIIISGRKILTNGLAHNYNTPFYRFEQAPESRYVFMDDVIAKVAVIESEVSAYLNGKRGEDPQMNLDFEEPITKIQIDKPEKKNGQKKKVKQTAEHPNGEMVE